MEDNPPQPNIDPATGIPAPTATDGGLNTNGVKPTVGAGDDPKMEVDPPQGIVKEEKMDVDEEGAENKENENSKPHVLLSSVDSSVRKEVTEIVTKLGGVLTESPNECTHLVMGKLSRTNNMLMCLPVVKHVLTTKWITDSGEAGKWTNEEDYILEDPEVEKKFNFSLSKTLGRSNRDKLFVGKVFYITPSVQPCLKVLTNIITYSGGRSVTR